MNAYNGKIIISHTEKIVFTYVLWNGAILSPGEQRSRDVAKYPTRIRHASTTKNFPAKIS